MGKIKVFILAAVAVIAIFFIAGAIQNSDRKPDEYTLIFEAFIIYVDIPMLLLILTFIDRCDNPIIIHTDQYSFILIIDCFHNITICANGWERTRIVMWRLS